jgi:hydroxyacylglutathione hydrolase
MIQFQDETVAVFQSALFHTTSTVVQTEDAILLVDPTWLTFYTAPGHFPAG